MSQYLIGIDVGTSSIKASIVDASTGETVSSAQSPAEEMTVSSPHPGWAEQHPDVWWEHTLKSITSALRKTEINSMEVAAIGISYQMHGLVVVDKEHKPLRPSIIWCDSRAVELGNKAFAELGDRYCLQHLLNSPGNFTASKLKWVQENEPGIYERIYKVMLPGDYIALKLTGDITTTETGLSEGMFWDYQGKAISKKLLDYYGIDKSLIATVVPVFAPQGKLREPVATELGLKPGIKISYRAGDQPNNAFSLNVLNPGETAATAGTSGVIYSVTDKNAFDPRSRVNAFIHVNSSESIRNGVLLCINGTGILNSWLKKNIRSSGSAYDYEQINSIAAEAPIGADGLIVLPFGNGTERILENRDVTSSFHGLNFNRHNQSHLFRAAQEGIVFALKYGFDILQEMGLKTEVIRAGNANMFLSPLFREAFVNTIGARLELYDTDGAKGAALGAGVGAGIFHSFPEAFRSLKVIQLEVPDKNKSLQYTTAFQDWKTQLNTLL
ncbi:MAG: FGGY family carbohydrate kinase [Bacteroidota bacterium]